MLYNGLFGINSYFLGGIIANSNFYNRSKIDNGSYKVYVNNDYVGNKVLITQGEDVTDIDGYLKGQGVTKFQAELDCGKYLIHAEDHSIAKRVKDVLNVYLNIR